MEIVAAILTGIVSTAASQVGQSIFNRLKAVIHSFCSESTDAELRQALDQIGNLTDSDIRRRVDELTRRGQLTPVQAEELTNLLLNLASGINFHTTQGT